MQTLQLESLIDADNRQQLRQKTEQQILREWELYPQASLFQSQERFLCVLNEKITQRTDMQAAWQRLMVAVRAQHQALSDWTRLPGSGECP